MSIASRTTSCVVVLAAAPAAAEPTGLDAQVQLDAGLSVVGLGYEHPLAARVAAQLEAMIFGSYFLPWFDAGDRVKGVGLGFRPTWFPRTSGHGPYVTPYVRGLLVDESSLVGADGLGVTAGAFVGWSFAVSDMLDLRVGAGAQYIHFHVETSEGRRTTSTPFVALDAVLGYRL